LRKKTRINKQQSRIKGRLKKGIYFNTKKKNREGVVRERREWEA